MSARSHRLLRFARHRLSPIFDAPIPRGAGAAAAALLIIASAGYGAVKGGHGAVVVARLQNICDAAADATGFVIEAIAIGGQHQVTREEILATTGITGRSSLLFLDVAGARARLKTNPWIADATVRKLYPNRLDIVVTERAPFALWQKDGRVSLIAEDGTLLEPYVASRFTALPFVVGRGAERQARDFLALIGRFPQIRDAVAASVLVAERRWNLRLRNGVDVRLPETNVEQALAMLVKLDREKNLLSRDIVAVDLRLPDRVTVRLSDAAAAARTEAVKDALKDKKGKRKGSDA